MSIRSIVTRGYGSFGKISEIVTRGYEAAPPPPPPPPPSHLDITSTNTIQKPVDCVLAGDQRLGKRKLPKSLMRKIFRE